jgi:hypothetical protein
MRVGNDSLLLIDKYSELTNGWQVNIIPDLNISATKSIILLRSVEEKIIFLAETLKEFQDEDTPK